MRVPLSILLLLQMVGVATGLTQIPYDNTLVLGNVISEAKIAQLQAFATEQRTVDAMDEKYNALLRSRLSLDMSMEELSEMNIGDADTMKELGAQKDALDKDIAATLIAKVKARMAYESKHAQSMEKADQTKIGEEPESPLNFATSKLQDMKISSDTMDLDVQYFRNEEEQEGSKSIVGKVSSHVSTTISSVFGAASGAKAQQSAESHMNKQTKQHEILGTIVMSVVSTHKNAKVFSPTNYDAIKLVSAWNEGSGAHIDLPAKTQELYAEFVAAKEGGKGGVSLNLLTGCTYGSSFIAFIHIVRASSTSNSESMQSSAASISAEATYSNFFTTITGGFGMAADTASDLKNLMSTSKITSHIGLQTQGIIPSLASQNVKTSVESFTKFSPDAVDGQLSTLAMDHASTVPTMNGAARSSIRAGNIRDVEKNKISAVLSGVGKLDEENNKVLDMNSLMLALDDYIKVTRDAESGVPVNFFVTHMDKKSVLREWFKQFRPDLYEAAMNGRQVQFDEGGGDAPKK